MQCPECQSDTMDPRMTTSGVELNECSECHSIWFDRGEILFFVKDLRAFDAVQCLITDRRRTVVDNSGEVIEDMDALFGVDLPIADAMWDWDIAPLGEIASNRAIRNEVHGFADLRSA